MVHRKDSPILLGQTLKQVSPAKPEAKESKT